MKSSIVVHTNRSVAGMQRLLAMCALVCLIVSAVLAPSVAAQPHRVIATVGGDGDITVSDVDRFLEQRPDLAYALARAEAHRQALEIAIGRRLKQYDFFNRGYHNEPAFTESVARMVTEDLVLAYGKDRYENRYLNEERIREEHELMSRRVIYTELVVNKSPGMTSEQLRVLRREVARVKALVDEGGELQEAERQLRRQVPSVASRIREGRLTWQETTDSPRALLIFRSEPGDVRSFEGPNLISVVRVERLEPVTPRPLEDVREEIVEALQGWYANAATNAFRAEWTSVIDVQSIEWNPEAIDQIITWAGTPGFLSGDHRRVVPRYVSTNGDRTIVSDGMTGLSISDLPRIFDSVLILSEGGRYTPELVREFVLEAVRTEEIAARARAIGLEQDIMTPNTPSPTLSAAMVRLYDQRHVDARIPEASNARLRSFYDQHVDSLFYQLRGVNIHIIERDTRDEIDSVWEEIQRGVRFEAASSRRLHRVYRRNRDGQVVSNLRSEPAYFADIAFDLEPGAIVGPVAFETAGGETRYAVIKSIAQYEERRLRFDEVEERVREEFLKHHRDRIERELRAQLEATYGVRVHKDVLEAYLSR